MSIRKTTRTDNATASAVDDQGVATFDMTSAPVRAIDILDHLASLQDEGRMRVIVLRLEGAVGRTSLDLGDIAPPPHDTVLPPEPMGVQRARILHRLLHRLDEMPVPTAAAVRGEIDPAGTGLLAACDIVLAAETASFGLHGPDHTPMPAVILPFMHRAIGVRACRRYMLTGERFDARRARALGLVHEILPDAECETRLGEITALLVAGCAQAHARSKSLLRLCASLDGSITAEACIAANGGGARVAASRDGAGLPGTAATPRE